MNSRAVKIAVSLLLTASLLCCSISVFADDNEVNPVPTVPPVPTPIFGERGTQIDFAAYIVWRVLGSWGIEFSLTDTWEFNHEVQSWIVQILLDYVGDLGETLGEWVLPWVFDYDIWGNMRINDTALEDIQEFAVWLINKFNLSDNQTIIVSEGTTMDGVNLYKVSSMISWENSQNRLLDFDPLYLYVAESAEPNSNTYYISYEFAAEDRQVYNAAYVIYYNNNGYRYCIISTIPYDIDRFDSTYYGFSRWKENYSIYTNTWVSSAPSWERIGNSQWYIWGDFNASNDYQRPKDLVAFEGTKSQLEDFVAHGHIGGDDSVEINTGEIMLPDDDPNYSEGDGLTIVDDSPDYSILDWDGTVSVDNLPAIVSTGTIENPEVDQIYTNIPAFFQSAGESMNAFKQIIFRMPDEVLICIYAVLSIGVIFGFLRIMREH